MPHFSALLIVYFVTLKKEQCHTHTKLVALVFVSIPTTTHSNNLHLPCTTNRSRETEGYDCWSLYLWGIMSCTGPDNISKWTGAMYSKNDLRSSGTSICFIWYYLSNLKTHTCTYMWIFYMYTCINHFVKLLPSGNNSIYLSAAPNTNLTCLTCIYRKLYDTQL